MLQYIRLLKGFPFCFLLLSIYPQLREAQVKSYSFPLVEMELFVFKDGRIQITEYRTYDFKGSFSWANRQIPTYSVDAVTDILVSELNTTYTEGYLEEPGSFNVVKKNGYWDVKWYYNARNEKRTFIITYTLEGVLKTGDKWSELYYNYLDNAWNKPTERFQATIFFESEAGSNMYFWNSAFDMVEIKTYQGKAVLKAQNLGKRDVIQARMVFPSA